MTCIKTGVQAYLENYGEWIIGDAYKVAGAVVFRVSGKGFSPLRTRVHFRITGFAHWYDQLTGGPSTMICEEHQVEELGGYQGIDSELVLR